MGKKRSIGIDNHITLLIVQTSSVLSKRVYAVGNGVLMENGIGEFNSKKEKYKLTQSLGTSREPVAYKKGARPLSVRSLQQ